MPDELRTAADSQSVCTARISIGFWVFGALIAIGAAVALLVARWM